MKLFNCSISFTCQRLVGRVVLYDTVVYTLQFILGIDDVYVKSGALNIEELPDNSFKNTLDAEAINIGLESKYQAECVRRYLWKRMMFIDPVSFS